MEGGREVLPYRGVISGMISAALCYMPRQRFNQRFIASPLLM